MPKIPLRSPRKKSIKPKGERKSVPVSKKTTRIRKKITSSPSMLEGQLASVIEQPGMTISVARRQRTHKPRSKKIMDATTVARDRIQSFDHSLARQAEQGIKARLAKRVPIHHGPHEASAHVLSLEGTIEHPSPPPSEFIGPSIRDWVAPYDVPPSLEDMVAHTKDLYLDRVDPRLFLDQFTPHDADVAFAERYGLWSKMRAPFIRWETKGERSGEHLAYSGERLDLNAPRSTLNAIRSTLHNQFTPSDADRAFYEVYGWTARLISVCFSYFRDVSHFRKDVLPEPSSWAPPELIPRLHVGRVMAGFIILLMIVSVPAGAVSLTRNLHSSVRELDDQSRAALVEIQAAAHSSGASQLDAWHQASKRFQAADKALSNINTSVLALAQLLPETRSLYQNARAFLQTGDEAVQAGRLLSQGLTQALEEPTRYPDDRLLTFLTYLEAAQTPLERAVQSIGRIDMESVPEKARPQANQLRDALVSSEVSMRELHVMTQLMLAGIGHERPHTYLFVFQNNTELRPTGGFMGSLAEVTFDRGEIKKVFVPGGGPYDFRDQLLARVVPPKPLQLVASRWELQDANWFPDFPASAKKIRWFWSQAGQPSLDGVIAVNANLMEKILQLTGPIDMPEYGKLITAENFMLETQKAVELEYDKTTNQPKKFIGDLMPKIVERLKQSSHDDWPKYLALISDALETKDVQISLTDPEEDQLAHRFQWRGEMKPVVGDTLSLIEANIAGQKTDGVIAEEVEHEAKISEDGSIIDQVTLTRRHTGQKGELFRGVNNVEYLRVYVPRGSKLLKASGYQPPAETLFKHPLPQDAVDQDVSELVTHEETLASGLTATEEWGRTVFGGWIQLPPGKTSTITITYRLPFTVFDLAREIGNPSEASQVKKARAAYVLLLTSQSGKSERQIHSRVTLPRPWNVAWSNETVNDTDVSKVIDLDRRWDRDQVMASLFDTNYVQAQ